MTPFTSILAATDFSVDGNNAVRRAALLAHEHGARLKLVHVLDRAGCKPLRDWFSPSIDIDLKTAQARESLRRFAVEIAGRYDVPMSVEVMIGEPLETLMQASERAELLVLGDGLIHFFNNLRPLPITGVAVELFCQLQPLGRLVEFGQRFREQRLANRRPQGGLELQVPREASMLLT